MIDNIDSLFKDRLEEVKPDTEMIQQDWDAMKGMMSSTPAQNGKLNGNVISKKIFVAISIACAVLVAAYLLLPVKKTTPQGRVANTVKKTAQAPPQFLQLKNTNTGLLPTTGNIKKHEGSGNPKPYFTPVDTTRASNSVQQDSASAIIIDKPAIKQKTNAEILDSFYNLLKTPTQIFLIDNTKDTTIIGRDSSEVTIPAKCFITSDSMAVTGKITLMLDECYSYTDIVANKVHTLSDGNLLQSGGMIQIKAVANGKNLALNRTKQLLVKMPTKKFDENMQLFLQKKGENIDTALQINWTQAGQSQIFMPLPTVKVLNLQDDPFDIVYRGNKSIGKFRVPKKCALNKTQIIAELKKRYPFYDEIRLRRCDSAKHNYLVRALFSNWTSIEPVIGDSIEVSVTTADRLKLWGVGQKEQYNRMLEKDSTHMGAMSKLENKYSFNISNLGWINCDHFYNDPRNKVRYVLNLKDTAQNYISQLIFLNCRLMMPAQISGNYISFAGIPEGEPVQLVSLGVKSGKIIDSVQKFTVSKDIVNNVTYEEIGAEEMKKQLKLSNVR